MKIKRDGEIGQDLVIETYNSSKELPKLYVSTEDIQNVDAVNEKGERYSIKTITEGHDTTSVLFGIEENKKNFDYVVIIELSKDKFPKRILELTWEQFLKHKQWNDELGAWNSSLTKDLLENSKIYWEINKIFLNLFEDINQLIIYINPLLSTKPSLFNN